MLCYLDLNIPAYDIVTRCPRCRPTSAGWTDNDRTPMNWKLKGRDPESQPSPSAPPSLTPREALNHESYAGGTLQFDCKLCGEKCGEIMLSDTTQKLYLDLQNYVCHDPSLPLLFDPQEADPDIPADAAWCCEMAHKFSVEQHITSEVLDSIELSLKAGELWKVLQKKMLAAESQQRDPYKSYIRIGVILKALGPVTAVLELWPSGHASPKHQHGGCAGSVRLLHGSLNVRLYKTLQSKEAMTIPGWPSIARACVT